MNHANFFDILMSLPDANAAMQYYLVSCALQPHFWKTMQHVVISVAVDGHLSQSEEVYL